MSETQWECVIPFICSGISSITVTVATNISEKTLAYVEENQDVFPNVLVDTVSLREYPQGEYFSHILGYIRQMTEADYALYQNDFRRRWKPNLLKRM